MLKLSKFQKDFIVNRIDLRIDVISDDIDSGTEFETEESLNELKNIIEIDSNRFSKEQILWIKEECENEKEMCISAIDDPELKNIAKKELNNIINLLKRL